MFQGFALGIKGLLGRWLTFSPEQYSVWGDNSKETFVVEAS
jgi:hypothetical protein